MTDRLPDWNLEPPDPGPDLSDLTDAELEDEIALTELAVDWDPESHPPAHRRREAEAYLEDLLNEQRSRLK